MGDLEDFLVELRSEVMTRALGVGSTNPDAALLRSAFTEYINELYEASSYMTIETNAFYREDGIEITRCNGYTFDDETGILWLFLADLDYEWSVDSKLHLKEISKLKKQVLQVIGMLSTEYLNKFIPLGTSESDFLRSLISIKDKVLGIRIEILTNQTLAIRKSIAQEKLMFDHRHINVVTNVTDLKRISELALSGEDRADIIFDLTASGGAPAVEAPSKDCLLAILPGAILAEFYEQHGGRLLEGNVRSYLQAKGKVNKGILQTLQDKPDKFFAFNNGLTIVCKSYEYSIGEGLLQIIEPQIVNGGQTTASLFKALEAELALTKVSVQAKIVKLPPDSDQVFLRNISQYSNTQNRISNADLFANDTYLVQMEKASKRFVIGNTGDYAYFERFRGGYLSEMMRLNGSERTKHEKKYPRARKCTKEEYALAYNAWSRKPFVVSKGAQKNFIIFADSVLNKKVFEFDADQYKTEAGKVALYRLIKTITASEKEKIPAHRNHVSGYTMSVVAATGTITKERLSSLFDSQELSAKEILEVKRIAINVHKELMRLVGNSEPGGVFQKSDTWISIAKKFDIEEQNDRDFIRQIPLAEMLELQTWVLTSDIGDQWDKGILATLVGYCATDWTGQGVDKPSDKQIKRFYNLYEPFLVR